MGSSGMKLSHIPGIYTTMAGSHVVDKVYLRQRIYHNFRDRGHLDIKEVEKYLKIQEGDIAKGIFKLQKQPELTVKDVLEFYWNNRLQHLGNQSHNRSTLNRLTDLLGKYTISDDKGKNQLKKAKLDEYKRTRIKSDNVSLRTAQEDLNRLSNAINYCVKCEMLQHNPISKLWHEKLPEDEIVLLDDGYPDGPQWMGIYQNIADDQRLSALILYETAMRPKELFLMKVQWVVKLAQNCYVIRVPPKDEKKGRIKEIPVSGNLLPDLLKKIEGKSFNDLIIPSALSAGFTEDRLAAAEAQFRSAFADTVQKYNKEIVHTNAIPIDVDTVTPYALRRTRITIWDQIDAFACRYAVGHKPKDVHGRNYARINHARLFCLVGIKYQPQFSVFPGSDLVPPRENLGTMVA